jgi:hypothetical protein
MVPLSISFIDLGDLDPHPFPNIFTDFAVHAGKCDGANDPAMVHRRRTEDSGIEQVQTVPSTGTASRLRRPPHHPV